MKNPASQTVLIRFNDDSW